MARRKYKYDAVDIQVRKAKDGSGWKLDIDYEKKERIVDSEDDVARGLTKKNAILKAKKLAAEYMYSNEVDVAAVSLFDKKGQFTGTVVVLHHEPKNKPYPWIEMY